MGDNCIICGSRLSDNNTTGIGFGCMANVVVPARSDVYREFCVLQIWIEKSQYVMGLYIERHKNTKFRSDFKKSFFDSMQNAERISKKQLEIMLQELFYCGVSPNFKHITSKIDALVNEAIINNREFYEKAIAKYAKLYLSGRKSKAYED